MPDPIHLRTSLTEQNLVESALGKFATFGHGATITPAESAAMAARICRLQDWLAAETKRAEEDLAVNVRLAGTIS